jgi:hypothetical protein
LCLKVNFEEVMLFVDESEAEDPLNASNGKTHEDVGRKVQPIPSGLRTNAIQTPETELGRRNLGARTLR